MNIPVDVRKWLPGDAVFDGSLFVPIIFPKAPTTSASPLLDPRTGKPAVRFGIAGRDPDDWYSEGQIRVTKTAECAIATAWPAGLHVSKFSTAWDMMVWEGIGSSRAVCMCFSSAPRSDCGGGKSVAINRVTLQ